VVQLILSKGKALGFIPSTKKGREKWGEREHMESKLKKI
jgi:hypothetical protein